MATNPSDSQPRQAHVLVERLFCAAARLPRRGRQLAAEPADPESLSAQAERLLCYEAESPIEVTLLGREPRATLLP